MNDELFFPSLGTNPERLSVSEFKLYSEIGKKCPNLSSVIASSNAMSWSVKESFGTVSSLFPNLGTNVDLLSAGRPVKRF